jgi:hypothetical protein
MCFNFSAIRDYSDTIKPAKFIDYTIDIPLHKELIGLKAWLCRYLNLMHNNTTLKFCIFQIYSPYRIGAVIKDKETLVNIRFLASRLPFLILTFLSV